MNVLIYGAGEAGKQIAEYCKLSENYKLIGFIDDDSKLQHKYIKNILVYPPEKISEVIKNFSINEIFISIPSIDRERYQQILQNLSSHHIHLRTLPIIEEIKNGKVNLDDVKEINIEDLLLRAPVKPRVDLMSMNVTNKIVLITGAGGSIGSELCRKVIRLMPERIILLDHAEFNLYSISSELNEVAKKINFPNSAITSLLVSVTDNIGVQTILKHFKPHTIFHAAAYKHVNLVENNISAAVRNNVLGTLYLAKAAYEFGVDNFTLISTDKAVRPSSIMGMTKRVAEMTLQSFAESDFKQRVRHKTCFSIVRFGNVLGSSGSVVPKFREQISRGKHVTVTHPEVVRFFMTIPEAAELVIQASSLAEGGDLFLLDMGDPVKIYDLAKKMIELSGKSIKNLDNPNGDIEIVFTGLKAGEKLFEEVLIDDSAELTSHPKILMAKEKFLTWEYLKPKIDQIEFDAFAAKDILCLEFLKSVTS